MNKIMKETKEINVMELLYADYNKYVAPKAEEQGAIEKTLNELSKEINDLSGTEKAEAIKAYETLYFRLEEVKKELAKLRYEHPIDIQLSGIARDIVGADLHNQTTDIYLEVNEKLKECAPIVNKLISLHGGFKGAPSLVYDFQRVLDTSGGRYIEGGTKIDKAKLINDFMKRYNELENDKKVKEKFSDKVKGILRPSSKQLK